MLRLEHEKDPKVLRQAALLLEAENRRLVQKVSELMRRLHTLEGKDEGQLALEIERLNAQLDKVQQQLYGRSSEKRKSPNDSQESTEAEGTESKRTGHGPRTQPNLPIKEQVHDLDEPDKTCPKCGGGLEEWKGQEEESEEITVIRRQFVLLEHKRKKYRCGCNGHVEVAPGPIKLIPGGRYSLDFAVEVGVDKYGDHMPLEREVRRMAREGLETSSQVLWDQLDALARVLAPLHGAIGDHVRKGGVLLVDETPWWMLKKARQKWQLWGAMNEDAAFYQICSSRSADAAKKLLAGFEGIMVCDAMKAYKKLARDGPRLILAGCNAHARRKFVEIEANYPEECEEILDLYKALYRVEAKVPAGRLTGGEATARLDLLRQLRNEESRPIMKEMRAWANATAPRHLKRSGLGEAIGYLLNHWKPLTVFLDDPRVPIDNNRMERGLRGPVCGRKNHHGSKSKRGTEVAAVLYSIVESCKLVRLDPHAYLKAAAETALRSDGKEVHPLPHQVADGLA